MTSNAELKFHQKTRWLPADTETPISLYLKMADKSGGILLESAEVDGRWGRYSILAFDMCFYISCSEGKLDIRIRDERFISLENYSGLPFMEGLREVLRHIEIEPEDTNLPPITRALYGYFGFGMASIFNPHLQKHMPAGDAQCILALPGTVMVFDHLYNRLCQLSINEKHPDLKKEFSHQSDDLFLNENEIVSQPDETGYKEVVRNICQQLHDGEAIQVVPSVRFCMPFSGNPFTLYRRLRRFNASPYMFYMEFPDITLLGASPEVMVRCIANSLQLSPIAGTRRRGKSEAEDQAMAKDLLNDPKELAEHVMLVDLGRNDLGKIAAPGSVRLEKYMDIERFSHVMHITSMISAELGQPESGKGALDALDVLAATFPAGTVSGAPKFRAMEIIREIEKEDRGPYAGCIGWIGLDKGSVNLDMGITIRSMWIKNGRLCWQAGGGIVHDSNPDLEWKEVCNKSAIMRMALAREDEDYVPAHR